MTKTWKSIAICSLSLLMAGTAAAGQLVSASASRTESAQTTPAGGTISNVTGKVGVDTQSLLDPRVAYRLPEGLDGEREISVIVKTADRTVLTAFLDRNGASRYREVGEYADSDEGRKVSADIGRANADAVARLNRAGVSYRKGASYDTLLGGFEVVVKAKEYEKIVSALEGSGADAYISEEYAVSEAQVVTNDVNVYGTGIFDSSASDYDGRGTVVAVLDTGLDYTHSVFDNEVFMMTMSEDDLRMTRTDLEGKVGSLHAAEEAGGLTVADVYRNEKVPYGFDYADHDKDVFPLDEAHGTHVSGVIAGDNRGSKLRGEDSEEIIGVAPKAQIAAMKVFSDNNSGARWSWIVSALEDCVTLGVDVINMSLGATAGFSVETEEEQAVAYDLVEKAGISLICAASNDYNSTYGSEKNGNLGLTSNPDSGTVGSPSTYSGALSVASISGVKTSYLRYNNEIMYFTESSDAAAEPKDFVEELFNIVDPDGQDMDVDYVTIPGVGRESDFIGQEVAGKVALIKRGSTNFEEKARLAMNYGAIGAIIYNNVSGTIAMSVGNLRTSAGLPFPVCSISQDNGELLAAQDHGTIKISRSQKAGPFMSDFSSWGPTPDLRIKPEITAHGGDILSCVPGEGYDRMSGTSMASPNQAGVTALVRQYVKEHAEQFGIDLASEDFANRVNAVVYSLMMSTADIAKNKNGLPYAVRKQGAGLANLAKTTSTEAYLNTFERDDTSLYDGTRFTDVVMDRAKIEIGDDPQRLGEYELKFNIINVGTRALTFDTDAVVLTEGVSVTTTYKGDTTVDEEGTLLSGAKYEIVSVTGGTQDGKTVTVPAGQTATVSAYIRLGETDMAYLDRSFENGMYVEGFVTLAGREGAVSLNVPFLAFYGDWTQAPQLDLDYFATDRDALDPSFDSEPLDRTLPDAVATVPLGGLNGDYISYLGSYYFQQEPSSSAISANREHIALSSDPNSVTQIYSVSAGLLRGAKKAVMTVTDDSTGELIWTRTEYNQRKATGSGGAISGSSIEAEFNAADFRLQDNTRYTFRLETFLDYGDGGVNTNKNRVFEFPFVMDSTAPILERVEYYTEYDRANNKTKLFARMYIFDNHYTMAMFPGVTRINPAASEDPSEYGLELDNFTTLPTPVVSDFRSTSVVTYELTNYLDDIRGAAQKNTYYVGLYDYALNFSIYEVTMPDEVQYVHFAEDSKISYEHGENGEEIGDPSITLQGYETYRLAPEVFPASEWKETLRFVTDESIDAARQGLTAEETVVRIVNGTLIGLPPEGDEPHETNVYVYAADDEALENRLATLHVIVGPAGDYSKQWGEAGSFGLRQLYVNNAFHFINSSDRDIGATGDILRFAPSSSGFYAISMYPSEKVTATAQLDAYFPGETEVVYESSNPRIVTANASTGEIEARAFGNAQVTATVRLDGRDTLASFTIVIEVKDPIERNGPYLTAWRGIPDAEGTVAIDEELGFTQFSQYAFSHYDYIPKDPWDEISEEDPFSNKMWYAGENDNVRKVIVPEGVETIGAYAFAGMEGLEEVVLPSTVNKIATGAFMGCTALRKINLENVQFIGLDAFAPGIIRDKDDRYVDRTDGVPLQDIRLDRVVGIGNNAFSYVHGASTLFLLDTAQSIGSYAFAYSTLTEVTTTGNSGSNIKFGAGVFAGCTSLASAAFNTTVIPDSLFEGCTGLRSFTLGEQVEEIGYNAFSGTRIRDLGVSLQNLNFFSESGVLFSGSRDDAELVLIVPGAEFKAKTFTEDMVGGITVTSIGVSAFSGNSRFTRIDLPHVTEIGDYAFWGSAAANFNFGTLTRIGAHAFENTELSMAPFGSGNPALSVDGLEIGDYAFHNAFTLVTRGVALTFGNNVSIGAYAFADSKVGSVTIGSGAAIGTGAFMTSFGAYYEAFAELYADAARYTGQGILPETDPERCSVLRSVTLGADAAVGDYAFAGSISLETVTFTPGEHGTVIGNYAFYLDNGLKTLVNSSAVKSVGDYAFAGAIPCIVLDNTTVVMDYYIPGDDMNYLVSTQLTSVDLSGAESVGNYAFAYNVNLESVTLSPAESGVTIGDYAFFGAALSEVNNLASARRVGAGAFASLTTTPFWTNESRHFFGNTLETADLSGADEIGANVFENSLSLTRVILKEGARVGASAFAGATALEAAENLGKAVSIGARAFFNTALKGELDLSSAEEIGDFAFGYLRTEENEDGETVYHGEELSGTITGVILGSKLRSLGDNPFAGRDLPLFARREPQSFHGHNVGETVTTTFEVSDNVKVIDGALYARVPAGYELICYPAGAENTAFSVAEGSYTFASDTQSVDVVRIAARAFQGVASLREVRLPYFLKSIGDKAFFGAGNLRSVVFQSLTAPYLEEDYDEDYFVLAADIYVPSMRPDEDGFSGYRGNGAIAYSTYTSIVLRTANFIDYIGSPALGDLTMIRPKNGSGYDNFLYNTFFAERYDGAAVMEAATLALYEDIDALPSLESITLEEHGAVVDALVARYNAILSAEQRGLITNYDKLQNAAEYIETLREGSGGEEPPHTEHTDADGDGLCDVCGEQMAPEEEVREPLAPITVALSVVVAVFGAALIALGVVLYIKTGRKKGE